MSKTSFLLFFRHHHHVAANDTCQYGFSFTPSISLYVTCDTEEEIDRVFDRLAQEGSILMPLAAYPFSKKFGWVADRFGVTWQLTKHSHAWSFYLDWRTGM